MTVGRWCQQALGARIRGRAHAQSSGTASAAAALFGSAALAGGGALAAVSCSPSDKRARSTCTYAHSGDTQSVHFNVDSGVEKSVSLVGNCTFFAVADREMEIAAEQVRLPTAHESAWQAAGPGMLAAASHAGRSTNSVFTS
eukprot:COSAG02_NODE_6987_length_3247_cov_3.009536_1_plen_142_part_00